MPSTLFLLQSFAECPSPVNCVPRTLFVRGVKELPFDEALFLFFGNARRRTCFSVIRLELMVLQDGNGRSDFRFGSEGGLPLLRLAGLVLPSNGDGNPNCTVFPVLTSCHFLDTS